MLARIVNLPTLCVLVAISFATSGAFGQTAQVAPADKAAEISVRIPTYALQDQVDVLSDPSRRMRMDVNVGGAGPFSFSIDSGSPRSVIATELAEKLGLKELSPVPIVRMADEGMTPTVHTDRIAFGTQVLSGLQLSSVGRQGIGSDGVIGLDGLRDRRLILDFQAQRMTVQNSKPADSSYYDNRTIVAKAQSKLGQLIISNARLGDQPVSVVIDTGADVTIGNMALFNMLKQRGLAEAPQNVTLDLGAGRSVTAQYAVAHKLVIGLAKLDNVPIYFFDAAPFGQWELASKPSMLLGMDMLRKFDLVAIDFGGRHVDFRFP